MVREKQGISRSHALRGNAGVPRCGTYGGTMNYIPYPTTASWSGIPKTQTLRSAELPGSHAARGNQRI
jgi:hypothetical protein